MKKLKGKKDIDKLFEGEWEGVCNVLWNPERFEMDTNTSRYFKRRIEHGIYLAQNIEMLRGGKPNGFWFDEAAAPAEFWKEHDGHMAVPFIDPVTAKYDRLVKRDEQKHRDAFKKLSEKLTGMRIRVKEGTRKSPLSDTDALFDCDGMCLTPGRKRPVLSVMDIPAGATGTIGALHNVPHRGKIYEVIWDDGEQEGFTYTKARGAYPLAQIVAGAVLEEKA